MKHSFIKYINEQFITMSDLLDKDCDGCSEKDSAKKRRKYKKKYHYENLLKYIQQHNVAQ
jgi:hypothetical protein